MTTGSSSDVGGTTGITLTPDLEGVTLPATASLTRLANELFAAPPGHSALSGAPGQLPTSLPDARTGSDGVAVASGTPPPSASALPDAAVPRLAPGALAGFTGRSPQAFVNAPAAADAESAFYFLRAAEPTSPRTAPALNVAPPGLEPGLGTTLPANFSALDPRSLADLSAPPGLRLGSTAPATPGVEVGSLPGAAAIPPASAAELPDEAHLRALPAALAAAKDASPQHALGVSSPLPGGAQFYFFDGIQPTPPRAVTPLNLKPRDANLDPLPDLGVFAVPGDRAGIPGSLPAGATVAPAPHLGSEPAGSPLASVGEASEVSLYIVNESRSFGGIPRTPVGGATSLRPETAAGLTSAHPGFDVQAVRRDFPILRERVHGHPLIWLDNAATTQKPQSVIDRLSYFYAHENSNIHRAAHELAARATDAYEAARDKIARFLHASSSDEIVFVRGTTEGINLVAQSWGRRNVGRDDEIVITWLEHHANIVPWQQLCAETGARLRVAPVDDDGQVLLDEYEKLLGPRTRLVAFSQVSNALGTITPAREMVEIAHRYGARVLVDGAQSVSHMRVDVQALDCDWFVFSGHKVFGPTGIGAVFGKIDLLNATPPWQGGGNMIQNVTFEKTVYQPAPGRFEAGTGNIADAVGLGAALDYVERIGIENVSRYEHDLLVYATHGLGSIPGLRIIGTAREKASVISFVLDGFRSEDVGAALNREGIAVRAGHHCAQPILRRFGLETTVRPSLAFYNTCEEVDALVTAVRRIKTGHLPH